MARYGAGPSPPSGRSSGDLLIELAYPCGLAKSTLVRGRHLGSAVAMRLSGRSFQAIDIGSREVEASRDSVRLSRTLSLLVLRLSEGGYVHVLGVSGALS
jgi:hypothetical protein